LTKRPYSPLTPAAIQYAWRQLLSRAGIATTESSGLGCENLGLMVQYGSDTWSEKSSERSVRVMPCSTDAWQLLLDAPPNHLDWLPISSIVPESAKLFLSDSVPVLFWGEGTKEGSRPFAEHLSDGSVLFNVDIIAAAFFMLSRWEEMVVPVHDEHERFPATASVAYRQGFLDRPIVDEYALILREWIKALLPGWEPEARQFSVRLEHDVDTICRFPNLYTAVLMFGGDLLKRRSPKQAWRTGLDVLTQTITPTQTSYFRGISTLSKLSHRHGIASAFYFMAAEPGPFDNGYDLSSPMLRRCIKALQDNGFQIGFHAGYHTLNDPERLAAEKARFDAAMGIEHYGGRQHYLRFRVPDTWRHYEQLGLAYDSTVVYADYEGFRCGTCHPFRPFDIEEDRELDLWERPLIAMDGTLHQYRGLMPEEGEARILELATRCKAVEGTFALLWHNASLDREWRPWAEMYQRVVRALAEMEVGEPGS
jgi:hypothetical protein